MNSGLYLIEVDQNYYFGQTSNFSERLRNHLGTLRRGCHDVALLPALWLPAARARSRRQSVPGPGEDRGSESHAVLTMTAAEYRASLPAPKARRRRASDNTSSHPGEDTPGAAAYRRSTFALRLSDARQDAPRRTLVLGREEVAERLRALAEDVLAGRYALLRVDVNYLETRP
jgi:hypothetical protein